MEVKISMAQTISRISASSLLRSTPASQLKLNDGYLELKASALPRKSAAKPAKLDKMA